MPTETGIFTKQDAETGHLFSYRLAQFIGKLLPKEQTVYDFGCGPASYLRYLLDIGFKDVYGIEGTTEIEFEIDKNKIGNFDLTKHLLPTYNGNVICLEVGEHIPADFTEMFLNNITRKKYGFIIISWAKPGQDGYGHINCQSNEWVIEQFEKRGFKHYPALSQKARDVVEPHLSYFKETILIFKYNNL